MSLNVWTKP